MCGCGCVGVWVCVCVGGGGGLSPIAPHIISIHTNNMEDIYLGGVDLPFQLTYMFAPDL